MKRVMSVWFPMLAIDRIRRRDRRRGRADDGRAILVAERSGQRHLIVHACERAFGLGVRRGMSVGDARAALPAGTVRVEPHAPGRDAAALEALAVWALRVSPVVSADGPDGLLLDVSGCAGVWGGEERLLGALVEGLGAMGIRAWAAIGPTFGCAWALARHGSGREIVAEGRQREALASLPLGCLRLEAGIIDELASLGVERVDQLLALPRRTLPARFGDGLLLRLDQALGGAIETIEPIRPVAPPRAERLFDGPTDQVEAIEWTVRDLLSEIGGDLLSREEGARRVEVRLARSDLEPTTLSVVLSRPSRDPKHLWAIIRPRLERAHLGFGVEGVTVTATRTAGLPHEQGSCWERRSERTTRDQGRFIDTLIGRLGPAGVLRLCRRDAHLPERAAVSESVMRRPLDDDEAGAPGPPGDRPTVLFERPIPIEALALTPDGPVLTLGWGGEQRRIRRSIGPERIGPEWWVGDRDTRDYFKVQDESGRWVWAYRVVATRAWFVHGCWA